MAIKVNGTTVIDDSRNLSNVGGLKTVNGSSLVGSGNISAGASTTAGAVGTYTWGRPANHNVDYNVGATASGIYPICDKEGSNNPYRYNSNWGAAHVGSVRSGTWRCMSDAYSSGGTYGTGYMGLWVRIS